MNSPEQQRITQRYEERDASHTLGGFWRITNPVVLHLAQERERVGLALLSEAGVDLATARLLDVGCGGGAEFPAYLRWGLPLPQVFGIDLMLPRLQAAQAHYGPCVANASGAALPFAEGSFDIVSQHVVFSSVIDAAMRRQIAAEMLRVLRPGGCVLWYDAVRTRGHDPHFRNVPLGELHALFPGLRWHEQRLTSDLGVLKRVHAAFGRRGIALLEALCVFKTHVMAVGLKA